MTWRSAAMMMMCGLAACAEIGVQPLPPLPSVSLAEAAESIEFPVLAAALNRSFEEVYTEEPFANGSLSVIAEEEGQVATYRFVPCADGRAICAGGPQGPAGRLLRTLDWFVVDGLHGRTFWLSYGGDGYVERGGRYVPLAWDARVNGTGTGDAAVLETPYRH